MLTFNILQHQSFYKWLKYCNMIPCYNYQ